MHYLKFKIYLNKFDNKNKKNLLRFYKFSSFMKGNHFFGKKRMEKAIILF